MTRLHKSITHAWKGLVYAFATESNLRIHVVAALAVLAVAQVLHIAFHDWIILFLLITVVITLELVNTGVERMLDIVKPRLEGQVGIVKDILAAAVLVASGSAFLIGAGIFLPYIIELFIVK
jgi:diacylglycerol kinase